MFRLFATATLALTVLVIPTPATAAQCTLDTDCGAAQSCVENRCWDLEGGVPARCVGYVDGNASAQCLTTSNWQNIAESDCGAAGGQLEDQVHADACGGDTYRSTLYLCCVSANNGGEVVSGTNVRQLRERLKARVMEEIGCAGSSDPEGRPVAAFAILGLALVLMRRRR